jgi:putative phage-type endonuclease
MQVFEDIEQGSQEWLQVRCGIITASNMGKVLAKGEGKTRKGYMRILIGERFTGEPEETYKNADMERGSALEQEARAVYASAYEQEIRQVGFIRNFEAIGGVGYSPDGLIGDEGAIEIKCRRPSVQVEVLETKKIEKGYYDQIQAGMAVSERKWIDFISYCPGLPLFVERVHRDQEYIDKMLEEAVSFYEDLETTMERISRA